MSPNDIIRADADRLPVDRINLLVGEGIREAPACSWPEPDMTVLSANLESAPEFPVHVFGRFWSQFLIDSAICSGAAVEFVAMPLLALAGSLLANARRVQVWDGWVEAPIIWTALVGLPSTNKSPAIDRVLDIAMQLEQSLNTDYEDRRRRYATERQAAEIARAVWEKAVTTAVEQGRESPLLPSEAIIPTPPARHRIRLIDCTIEKAARLAASNGWALLQCRDELAGWLGNMNRYSGHGGDRAFWLEAHRGRSFLVDRMRDDEPVIVPSLGISVVGGIQPERLSELLLANSDDGLASRFLYVWPERINPIRPDRSPDAELAIRAMEKLVMLPVGSKDDIARHKILHLSPPAVDAVVRWRQHWSDMEGQASGLMVSWLGKQAGNLLRVAIILAFLRWVGDEWNTPEPAEIGKSIVEDAAALIESSLLPMAKRTFGEASLPEQEKDACYLARWICSHAGTIEIINLRTLRRKRVLMTKEARRYDAAATELVEAGWLRTMPAASGGRPRKEFEINPGIIAQLRVSGRAESE